jgi:signal transduction histidine kinase/FixJ family two-component response regulator
VARLLTVGGEMAGRIGAFDWGGTPLGPIQDWPISLRATAAMVLENRFPMTLFWGRDLLHLYNDAYAAVLGDKHPAALGQPASAVWAEIWPIIGPQTELVLSGKGATWNEHLLLPMERKGFLEETYFTFSYSPVRDDRSAIGGMLVTCQETTQQIQGERQLQMLRDLGSETIAAESAEAACQRAAGILGQNDADIPFALLYLVRDGAAEAELVATAGLDAYDGPGKPPRIAWQHPAPESWPLAAARLPGSSFVVTDLEARFGRLPGGRWKTSPERAVILALVARGQSEPYGFLIAGASPMRVLDERYQRMFQLAADQIVTAVSAARAFEEERTRAQALAALDRAKTAFFSNVSHEFRTPLMLMLSPTEDLLSGRHGPLSPAQRAQLELLHRNAIRLHKLVNSLLDFSRLEAGRIRASYEPVDLAVLTRDLVSSFRAAVERAGLALEVDCPPLSEPFYVDRDMWEKIVLNLLSNALKFTFEGAIRVSLGPTDGAAALRVRDTGVGIRPEDIPRLFDRFYRGEGMRARTYEGSGIGLALVQELAKLHGGHVEVESALDRGSTFTVTIPGGSAHLPADRVRAARTLPSTTLGAAPFVEEALRWLHDGGGPEPELESPLGAAGDDGETAPVARPAAPSAERILVADDNADMRDYFRRLLEPRWTVEVVRDGLSALASAQARPPDLVLTDVMMPGLDGFALLRRLRDDERTRAVPVVVVSARAGEEATVEGLQAGADDYLTKPFSARELIARVETQLKMARLHARAEEERRRVAESEERYRRIFQLAEVSIWEEDFSDVKSFIDQLKATHGSDLRPLLQAHPELVEQAQAVVHVNSVNPATLRMFGASSMEELGKSAERIRAAETPAVFLELMIAIADGKRVMVTESGLRRLSGERIDTALTLAFSPDDARCERALLTLTDVSAQKVAQREREARIAEMERAVRFGEMLVGVVGHDLRNPLSAITAAAGLLERRADSDTVMKPVRRIGASAHRMERMIAQLLDFTRIRLGGGLSLERTRVDLAEVTRSIIDELEPVYRSGIFLQSNGDVTGVWDRDRLSQLLSNLTANACQHGTPGVPVGIVLDGASADVVRLEVRNGGVIPADLLPVVFEPLRHRGNGGKKRGGGSGLGLGLYITQEIAHAHGGTIHVESTKTAGTHFIVELPRART